MTIDEAIEYYKDAARVLEQTSDGRQCAIDYVQLTEWLRQARGAEKAERWYTAKIRELEKQVLHWKLEWESERDYADQMEAKERKAVAENDKLRELIREAYACYWAAYHSGVGEDIDWQNLGKIERRMREMGIEVDE